MTRRGKIEQDLIAAQKSKDQATVEALRFLLSAIKYREVDKKSDLDDSEVTQVVSKQVKTHQESIAAFQKGQRPDLVAKEQAQLEILQNYLPSQLSGDEVRERVTQKLSQLINNGQTVDFGRLMKSVMDDLKGQADGSLVKKVVDEVLKG